MRPVLLAASLLCLVLAAPAGAARAPGIATFKLDPRPTVGSVDVLAPAVGAPRPDGGAVLVGVDRGVGLLLVAVRPDGTPDPAFGTRGLAHVRVPFAAGYIGPIPEAVLRDGQGRWLVVYDGVQAPGDQQRHLDVARVGADGALDASYGENGIADAGVLQACGGCSPAALLADGSVLLTGIHDGGWVVARLAPGGTLDPGFGAGGVAAVAGPGSRGLSVAPGPAGSIVTLGSSGQPTWLTRLTASGTADPSFNGGAPVGVGPASDMLVRGDGSTDLLYAAGQGGGVVQRLTAAGVPDPTFGDGGRAALDGFGAGVTPAVLVLTARGSEVAVASTGPGQPAPGAAGLRLQRIGLTGADGPAVSLPLPVGGGVASFFARLRPVVVAPLEQTGYRLGRPIARPDGGLLLPGGTGVVQYTGEGSGYLHEEEVVAGLTADLALDPAVGGPAAAARATLVVPRQHASRAASTKLLRVAVDATTSGPGLAVLDVRGRGRLLARSTAPVLRTGRQRLRALLTVAGRRYLRHARGIRVTVTVRFRDLVGQEARATAHGTLR